METTIASLSITPFVIMIVITIIELIKINNDEIKK
jgi:hypothetical protein